MSFRPSHMANRIARRFTQLFGGEAGSGVLLIVVAALAMVLANSGAAQAYHNLFHGTLAWSPIAKLENLHLWINDAVMAVFFFVVGLEIKREVLDGDLASPERRRLPVLAAVAGMAIPALIYLAVAGTGKPLANGWAIPAATDIAFALGVLALVGKGSPPSLRLFLLTVAIVDDLGAVTIIALFYTAAIKAVWLVGAAAFLAGMVLLGRMKVARGWPYVLLAVALWYCVLHSGVHATIAGVLAAFAIPLRLDRHGDSLLLRMEHALVPWNAYLVVPLFGFANAGVSFGDAGSRALIDPVPLAVAAGLVLGKPVGILGAILGARLTGFAQPPKGANWGQLFGVSILCGIGFTMSLFIGALAFPGQQLLIDEAKIGVLSGSLASALMGFAALKLSRSNAA